MTCVLIILRLEREGERTKDVSLLIILIIVLVPLLCHIVIHAKIRNRHINECKLITTKKTLY